MLTDSFEFTNAGGRDENQDAVLSLPDRNRSFFAVADGLGGHQHGSLASRCVVSSLAESWRAEPVWDRDRLFGAVQRANNSVLALQQQLRTAAKSTVALLAIEGNRASCANSGDSRVYYVRDCGIRAVTEDHSVAYKKYKSGEITKEQIAGDEDQSSLLRALGNETRWEPEAYEIDDLKPGDAFLLCSDGFWEYVTDEEILLDCLTAMSAEEWAHLLLLRIMERVPGNNDNLSVVTVMLR